MDSYFLHTGKYLVELSDIEGLKNLYSELLYEYNQKKEYRLPIEFIYQQIFLHCCQHNFIEAIRFLFQVYLEMDRIQKMALRQLFYYGKLKLDKKHHSWYTRDIITKIKALKDKTENKVNENENENENQNQN